MKILVVLASFLAAAIADCPCEWEEFNGKCFYFVSKGEPFTDAGKKCRALGGKGLAIIDTKAENDYIYKKAVSMKSDLYIANDDIAQEGLWTYENVYSNWQPGEPNNYRGAREDCVEMYTNGKWNDLPCGYKKPYICQYDNGCKKSCKNAGEILVGDTCYRFIGGTSRYTDDNNMCIKQGGTIANLANGSAALKAVAAAAWNTKGWGHSGGHIRVAGKKGNGCATLLGSNRYSTVQYVSSTCYRGSVIACQSKAVSQCEKFGAKHYRLFTGALDAANAQKSCKNGGGKLAIIETAHENEFIRTNFVKKSSWIGLHRHGSRFTWNDVYTNWRRSTGEPNNAGGNEDCAVLKIASNGQWNDQPCKYHVPFVCWQPAN